MFEALRRLFGKTKSAPRDTGGGGNNDWGSLSGYSAPSDPAFAENLAGVAACVSLISGTIATLPAVVFKRTADDQREVAGAHPLARIVRDGYGGVTWSDMLAAWIGDVLLNGNAVFHIETDASGRLAGLRWLPWSRISTVVLPDRSIVYNYVEPTTGRMTRYLDSELVHLRDRLDSARPWLGKSRLARSPGVLALANTMHQTAQSFSGNLARPGGYLTAPQKIDDDTARRLKDDFDNNFTGKRSGRTAVLGNGLEFKVMGTNDAQAAALVPQLLWSMQECARLYNVPPQLIGDLSSSTFTNSAQAARSLAVFCLNSWVQKINAVFDQSVLFAPFCLEIDLSELMRGDTETYFKSLALFRNSAIITANEVRELTGFDRSTDPDADELEAVQHAGGGSQPGASDDPANEDPGAKPVKTARPRKTNGHAGAH